MSNARPCKDAISPPLSLVAGNQVNKPRLVSWKGSLTRVKHAGLLCPKMVAAEGRHGKRSHLLCRYRYDGDGAHLSDLASKYGATARTVE